MCKKFATKKNVTKFDVHLSGHDELSNIIKNFVGHKSVKECRIIFFFFTYVFCCSALAEVRFLICSFAASILSFKSEFLNCLKTDFRLI